MRRAELAEQLERLGSAPVPVPDRRRLQLLSDQLQREFVPAPGSAPRRGRAAARHHRRVVLVGAGLAAAAAAFVAVVVVQREPREQIELQAASDAVLLLPGGSTRDLGAGDHIPSGGLIRTGPGGTVTVEGTEIGPDQMVLVEDDRLTLLPAPAAAEPEVTVPAPLATVATAPEPPVTAADLPADVPADPPPAALPTAPPIADVTAAPTPMAAAAPAEPAPLPLTVSRQADGIRLSWTAVDAPTFAAYVVVRGPEATDQLEAIAVLPDRQITSFTDPSAPADVDLEYRVVALDTDHELLALSSAVSLRVDDAIPADADADADSVTSTTDGQAPGSTDGQTTGSTSPPTSTDPPTSAATTAPESTTTSPTTVPSEPTTAAGPPATVDAASRASAVGRRGAAEPPDTGTSTP